ncbi:transglycosylase SLT domain-containing protein [Parvibium lacunae]|uniref:LysM peptidoglycan-binding domain-containing protein n=1 Tax=Parvibium lacunae TaxID=1888893 RepID=A0A368L6R9_9BURK|nr:transglycosylase SLT domain-containing protein [Parvibium lacunae]RCS59201.1 LysM peptidoglycan-binding domain-containing protein [Parvibium lacunae]
MERLRFKQLTVIRGLACCALLLLLAGGAAAQAVDSGGEAARNGLALDASPLSSAPPAAPSAAPNRLQDPLIPRTLDLTAPAPDIWQRIRNGFAIPNLDSALAAERTNWYAAKPEAIRRMAERAGRYLYHIVEECEKRGLPTELALLPFVESAFNPIAYSPAKASGIWQFIPSTGKNYGLDQNWWLDERRDILASTDAALNYLAFLFDFHGDWYLALASYNWGEGAVKRAIEKNKARGLPTDYESLTMPNETRYYVPKLQAIKNLVANPARYGITLPPVDNAPYFTAINNQTNLDIRTAAKLAGMSVEEFKQLNPAYNRPVILGKMASPLLIPSHKAMDFLEAVKTQGGQSGWRTYTLSKGEKLDSVAQKFGTNTQYLRELNGLGLKTKSLAGMTLLVPGEGQLDEQRLLAQPVLSDTPALPSPPKYNYHLSKKGETLASLAKQYGTTISALRQLNGLKTNSLRPGQKLLINTPQETRKPHAPKAQANSKSASQVASKGAANKAATTSKRQTKEKTGQEKASSGKRTKQKNR